MKDLRVAWTLVKTLFKDRIFYPGRLVTDTVAVMARCGIVLLLYSYVFGLRGGTVAGITFDVAAWSMFLYFWLSVLRIRELSKQIIQDVQSGAVELMLNKPVSYLWYRWWWQVGAGLYPFLVILVLGTLVLFITIGFPATMLNVLFLPTILLSIVGGIFLALFIYAIIGLTAFWIEDSNPIFWIVDKMVMILGGSYLPVALFPDFVKQLAIYSPFGASQFITHTVYVSWQDEWWRLLAIQLFWIVVLGSITYLVFQRARRRVSVNGG